MTAIKLKKLRAVRKQRFIGYLRGLAIDTKASGMVHTAQDLRKCASLISKGKKDPRFAHFLKSTLIPDLRRSKSYNYAEDFRTCARHISK